MSAPIVRMRLSGVLLLQHLLHLDQGILLGASVEALMGDPGGASSLVLYLRYPDAPEGADEMSPVYLRYEDGKVEVTSIDWYSEGCLLPGAGNEAALPMRDGAPHCTPGPDGSCGCQPEPA